MMWLGDVADSVWDQNVTFAAAGIFACHSLLKCFQLLKLFSLSI